MHLILAHGDNLYDLLNDVFFSKSEFFNLHESRRIYTQSGGHEEGIK